MARQQSSGSTPEPLLNAQVANLLRRYGLEAQAEQRIIDRNRRHHQIDILVELDDITVAIEAEFSPARTVRQDATALKKRPLTDLYNTRPQWLADAYAQLDAAVAAAFGWPGEITDNAALHKLLARNRLDCT